MSFFITKILQFFLFILGLIPLWVVDSACWLIMFGRKTFYMPKLLGPTKTINTNLRLAFPELDNIEILSLTRISIVETMKTIGELGLVWSRLPGRNLSKHIKARGLDSVSDSLDKKNGLILFAPHLSNVEVMLNCVARHLPCMVLYTPSKNKYFDKVMLAARNKMGAEMVEPNIAGVKSMLNQLKQGGVVLIASDQVPNLEGGLLSNFFSTPALTMTLASKLKLKTGAPSRAVYCLRKPTGTRFEVVFSREIEGMDLGMQSSVDRMNEELEKCIMNAPEQYAWEYKRYKHSGLKDIY